MLKKWAEKPTVHMKMTATSVDFALAEGGTDNIETVLNNEECLRIHIKHLFLKPFQLQIVGHRHDHLFVLTRVGALGI